MRLASFLMKHSILNVLSTLRNISCALKRVFLLQFRGRVKMADSNVKLINLSNHLHRDECGNLQIQFWICYFPPFSVKFSFIFVKNELLLFYISIYI